MKKAIVGIIMGSDSDLHIMQEAAKILDECNIAYELTIVSAHRTPDRMHEYARSALGRGLKVIIAGAGGAAPRRARTAGPSARSIPALRWPAWRSCRRSRYCRDGPQWRTRP